MVGSLYEMLTTPYIERFNELVLNLVLDGQLLIHILHLSYTLFVNSVLNLVLDGWLLILNN